MCGWPAAVTIPVSKKVAPEETTRASIRGGGKVARCLVELKCPGCGMLFHREKRQTFLSKKGKYTACSRACSGLVSTQLQNVGVHPVSFGDSLSKRIAENFVRVVQEGQSASIACSTIVQSHKKECYTDFTDPL
jgi:hypothetical protein